LQKQEAKEENKAMTIGFSPLRNYLLLLLPLALCCNAPAQEFRIPEIGKLPRVDRNSPRPSPYHLRNSAFILKFKDHAPQGEGYVILTDHTEKAYLQSLERLSKRRKGTIIKTKDLAKLHLPETIGPLRRKLQKLDPKYVALAPRMESYRENMVLGTWELLSTLDEDRYIDAYPGILLASSVSSFKQLIDRTIDYRPIPQSKLKTFAISQVPSDTESRSLQKAGILRDFFANYGIKTPTVAIYTPSATNAPELKGDDLWKIRLESKGNFVKKFDPKPREALHGSQLVIMHGHGIPGMSCSVDLEGIPAKSKNQVILSGSCFSAVPVKSDFPRMTSAPGGYKVSQRPAFATRYVDQGATVFFGHMRLSSGFPHLYPVLEKWLGGATVGEAYQQLINGLIDMRGFEPGRFVVKPAVTQRRLPQNTLLYIVFGDPALVPFEPLAKTKQK
jgi:hypothetical protein